MKALSLKQPWAELILQGRKKIELRKWNTHFRGAFLIHASKKPDKNAMKNFGFKSLPCGCIVGKASIVSVKKYRNRKEHLKDKHLHLGTELWGNYGFVLEDVRRIRIIPCKGKLNFWEFDIHNLF